LFTKTNPARKFRRLLKEAIVQIASDEGMDTSSIKIYEADCWQHLRNVWVGAVIASLGSFLDGFLGNDIVKFHFTLRITTDAIGILRAVEKYFSGQATHEKGKGSMFVEYMDAYHRGEYLYPVARACGGSRQDIGTEGAGAVLLNLLYYLEFLVWQMSCGGDVILEKNLYTMLWSVEMVVLLRVLTIIHISFVLPHRWLVGKCGGLDREFEFGVTDMAEVVDLMDSCCDEIVRDGSKLLDNPFMMEALSPIAKKVTPFQDYLDYIFEEKSSYVIGSLEEDDKVLPWDILRASVFFNSERHHSE